MLTGICTSAEKRQGEMERLGIGLLAAASAMSSMFAMIGIAAGTAAAAPTVIRPVMYSAEQAGAAVHAPSVHYRYVQTTFTLPRSTQLPYSTGGALTVQLRSPGEMFQLGIFAKPGTFWNAKAMDTDVPFVKVGPSVLKGGDSITLSAYFNAKTGYLYFSAVDNTSGVTFGGRFMDAGAMFGSVRVGAEFAAMPDGVPASAFIRPPGDYRLALLTGTKITQLNGTRVSLIGSTHVIETSTGTSAGRVQVNAPTVYNYGANTGIWVHH
jgi:hypothetical protein